MRLTSVVFKSLVAVF